MTLLKTSFWTALSTGIRLIVGFVIAKILAVYLGPIGFAVIGQFQNFIQMVLTFAGGMIQTGVVKYIAEFRDNELEKAKILSTAFWICLISSLIIGIILFLLRDVIAVQLLQDVHLSEFISLFALTLAFYVFNTFLISVLNGEGAVKCLTLSNIGTSILGLIFTLLLVHYYHFPGALLALVLTQSIVFFFTLSLVMRSRWFIMANFIQRMDPQYLRQFFKYALMGITTALMLPLMQIIIREYIGHTLSWRDAGYWQAMTKISDGYLMLITTTLSVYYLPKLSSLPNNAAIKKEIFMGYQKILPVAILLAASIFIFRHFIILVLFSQTFLPMQALFLFQLLGDVFKIGSWLLGYTLLAKAMTTTIIFMEILFSVTYCLFTLIFIHWFGLIGATLGFACNYLVFWVTMAFLLKNRLSRA